MPEERPGRRYSCTATKATTHGAPVVEVGHPGIAAKSTQVVPMVVSLANAVLAQHIAIDEEFVIMLDGVHPVSLDLLPDGVDAGDAVYIQESDNSLVASSGSGTWKFGLVDEVDDARGIAQVNLSLRDVF